MEMHTIWLQLLLLYAAVACSNVIVTPPILPTSFSSNIIKHVNEGSSGGALTITNVTASYDGEKKMYHVKDYSNGDFYEAWFVQLKQGPVIYTYSPNNIPGEEHCTCLPTDNSSYLPEFLSLTNATSDGETYIIDGEITFRWIVKGDLLPGDTYTAYVTPAGIPVRTVWTDPMTKMDDVTVERADYLNFTTAKPTASEFVPNKHCLKVSCGGVTAARTTTNWRYRHYVGVIKTPKPVVSQRTQHHAMDIDQKSNDGIISIIAVNMSSVDDHLVPLWETFAGTINRGLRNNQTARKGVSVPPICPRLSAFLLLVL